MGRGVQERKGSGAFLIGMLGLLSAFGPFVMDMYLSSFPQIAGFYGASPSEVQMSLASCTAGLALGQLLFGFVSDSLGRKGPLVFSLLLFAAAALGCLFSPSIALFNAMRFFQGFSAAGGVVLSRSVAADCFSGLALAKIFAVIGLINCASTVASPMAGGFVIGAWGWKAVFWLLLLIGLAMLAGLCCLRETLPREARTRLNPKALFLSMKGAAGNAVYARAVGQYSCMMAMIFINLASAPFILDSFGFSAEEISLVFGVNAVALGIAAGTAGRFRDMNRATRLADRWMLAWSLLIAAVLFLKGGFWLYEGCMFAIYMGIGVLCTSAPAIAMNAERRRAGAASALLGTAGYVAGAAVSPIVGLADVFAASAVLFVLVSGLAWATMPGKGGTAAGETEAS